MCTIICAIRRVIHSVERVISAVKCIDVKDRRPAAALAAFPLLALFLPAPVLATVALPAVPRRPVVILPLFPFPSSLPALLAPNIGLVARRIALCAPTALWRPLTLLAARRSLRGIAPHGRLLCLKLAPQLDLQIVSLGLRRFLAFFNLIKLKEVNE